MEKTTGKERLIFMAAWVLAAVLICSAGTALATYSDSVPDNGIPVVYINIDESQGTIKDMIESPNHTAYCYGTMTIKVPEGFKYSDMQDLPCEGFEDLEMSIRGRGNSTWMKSDKKPFKIKLENKTDVFGLGSNKHWVLVANAFDPSYIKDRITAWLGDKLGFEFTPRGVPVDLVITGSEYGTKYMGSYYLSENVRVDKNRLDIEELKESDTDPEIITGGYLIQNAMQVRKGSPDRFYTNRGVDWATHTPSFDTEEDSGGGGGGGFGPFGAEEGELLGEELGETLGDGYENSAQQQYIQEYIRKFEDILYDDGTAYHDLMDVESAAKYWLVNVVSLNHDAFGTGSTYIYKYRDTADGPGKIYWGPLWDFDYAWYYDKTYEGIEFGHEWIKPMLYDKAEGGFGQEVYKQWPVMKAALEELIADGGVIDGYMKETEKSAEQDRTTLHKDRTTPYSEEIDLFKEWLRKRIDWVDENLSVIDDMVHRVTFVADGESYMYMVSTEYIDGTEPHPEKDGYRFVGWMDEEGNLIEDKIYVRKDMVVKAKYIPESEVTRGEELSLLRTSDVVKYNPNIYTYAIKYTVFPEDAMDKSVVWTSSDEEFAEVDEDGAVIYKGPGTVTVTGTLSNGVKKEFTLTITEGELPAPYTLSPETEEVTLIVGEQAAFTVKTDPDPAKIYKYIFSSDGEEIATVDEDGVITALSPGSTTIRLVAAVSSDGNEITEASMDVTVNEAVMLAGSGGAGNIVVKIAACAAAAAALIGMGFFLGKAWKKRIVK